MRELWIQEEDGSRIYLSQMSRADLLWLLSDEVPWESEEGDLPNANGIAHSIVARVLRERGL